MDEEWGFWDVFFMWIATAGLLLLAVGIVRALTAAP